MKMLKNRNLLNISLEMLIVWSDPIFLTRLSYVKNNLNTLIIIN